MTNDTDALLLALARDAGFQNEVAQVRAKSVLRELNTDSSRIRWTYDLSRVVRNAVGATFLLEREAREQPNSLIENQPMLEASLRVAQLWEALAKLQEGSSVFAASLNSAVAYEIAGYQANAACLAEWTRRLPNLPPELLAVTDFLRRRFLGLSSQGETDPRLTPPPEKVATAEFLARAGDALLLRGLTQGSRYFLSGNPSFIETASTMLDLANRAFSSVNRLQEANLARGIASLLRIMERRSTWHILGNRRAGPRWKRYLQLLARGTGEDVLRSSSVSELWPSQLKAIEQGVLDRDDSFVLRLPTSAGKTRVAELAMVDTLTHSPGSRCIYVAPYRALVSELQRSFLNLFADLGFTVSSFLGEYEGDPFESDLARESDVLVVTPERLDLLQREQPGFFESVRLVVLDEGQIIHESGRGIKYELLLTRLKRQVPEARFLFLSAVVPEETLLDFSNWLRGNPDGVITSDWRPSVIRVARFRWDGTRGVVEYAPSGDLEFRGQFVHGVIQEQTYEYVNPLTGRINRPRFPDRGHRAQTAAELAFEFSEVGPVLIFCPQTNLVMATAAAILERLELVGRIGTTIPSRFSTEDTRSVRAALEWLGTDHPVTRALRSGVAVHHGRLPDAVRTAVEIDYRERKYQVLVATNTLAQGVNLPVRTVIIHSVRRRDDDTPPEGISISARDYWNIAGRAGRAGSETEGTIIHLVMNRRDQLDFNYFMAHRDSVESVETALMQVLRDLVGQRISNDQLIETIDADILALLVEEDPNESERILSDTLSGSLTAVQARREQISLQPLEVLLQETAASILQRIPDADRMRVFRTTGLSVDSCLAIQGSIKQNQDSVRQLLTEDAEIEALVEALVAACLGVQEMQPKHELGISFRGVLSDWLNGRRSSEIASTVGAGSPGIMSIEQMSDFISDYVVYRLPWGAAAYLRIAIHELGLQDDELSLQARFLPALLKFGVRNPVAAWGMSMGLPDRTTATRLAIAFEMTHQRLEVAAFRSWLSTLDWNTLREEFGLQGEGLADTLRAIAQAGPTPQLRDLRPLGEELPTETSVVGLAFDNRWETAASLRPGDLVSLSRDYDNAFDRNAISLQASGRDLGFLSRTLAQRLAPELDSGVTLRATVVAARPDVVSLRIDPPHS